MRCRQCNAGMLPVDLAGECVWTGGCPLTEVVIGARNDEGLCTYGDCSNDRLPLQCRRGANECGPTPARDDGYYAERLPNGSGVDGPATSSALQLGMYDTCRYLVDSTMVDGVSETCKLPTLRAPNGFEQRTGRTGPPFVTSRRLAACISLNRDDCFYLDATFCGGALASAAESPAKARRRAVKHSPPHPQMLSQPAHHTLAHPTSSPPLHRVACKAACRECYDFTATLLHEAGHFLGLGDPDRVVPITNSATGEKYPQGSNHHLSAPCGPNPWALMVPGVPDGAELDPHTGVRPAAMATTQDAAR